MSAPSPRRSLHSRATQKIVGAPADETAPSPNGELALSFSREERDAAVAAEDDLILPHIESEPVAVDVTPRLSLRLSRAGTHSLLGVGTPRTPAAAPPQERETRPADSPAGGRAFEKFT